jgi:oligopeptide/dipeptide ABC transporter ATP-binding protein
VVEEGPVGEVLNRPHHPYTIALYQCLPHGRTVTELQTIPGTVPDLIDPPTGCRFHPRCSHVMERCPTEKPQPILVAEGHSVSCFWAAEKAGVQVEAHWAPQVNEGASHEDGAEA